MKLEIVRGTARPPERIVIYGPPGVGKSTWAAKAPGALALDYERGLEQIGVARVRGATTWPASLEMCEAAATGPGDHRTLVIDTVDRLEDQATKYVCDKGKKKSLADFGYGDGFEALVTEWRSLLYVLEGAAAHGREVILVAHVQTKSISDPTLGSYGKFVPALQKRSWGATHRWADATLFANYEAGLLEGRAVHTGARQLHTVAGSGYEAKNRWNLPEILPLEWPAFAEARASMRRSAEEVVAAIRALCSGDDEARAKAERFVEEAAGDVPRLVRVEKALHKKLNG